MINITHFKYPALYTLLVLASANRTPGVFRIGNQYARHVEEIEAALTPLNFHDRLVLSMDDHPAVALVIGEDPSLQKARNLVDDWRNGVAEYDIPASASIADEPARSGERFRRLFVSAAVLLIALFAFGVIYV